MKLLQNCTNANEAALPFTPAVAPYHNFFYWCAIYTVKCHSFLCRVEFWQVSPPAFHKPAIKDFHHPRKTPHQLSSSCVLIDYLLVSFLKVDQKTLGQKDYQWLASSEKHSVWIRGHNEPVEEADW